MSVTNSSLANALQGSSLIQIGLPISLFILMTGVGLTLRLKDFRSVLDYPRALILGTLAQIVFLPGMAFALALLLSLPPAIAVGLVVVAACPGGTTSNVFAFLGKGNLALSILMTASASLITVITLPLFANWAIGLFTSQAIEQPLQLPIVDTFIMLLVIIFLPVMLGMGLRSWKTGLAGKLEGAVSAFGMVVLFALVILIAYQTRDHLLELLLQAGPSVIALNVIGIATGFVIARLGGHDFADGLTLAMELGIKNSTIGLTVTLTLLGSADIAMPAALYGLLMFFSAGILVAVGRRHARLNLRPKSSEIPPHIPDDVGFKD
ncbi:MAG: bile acid:sodium symporter family protein [Wenzhouxiangella sp.]|jgi:BASS family bile acid:Na+ symporter|nr:bile acid:sodium symporter family protein [Wenzhouxiangella sp.]